MPTVSAGSTAKVYCPLASAVTVTPTVSASVRVSNAFGDASFQQARISGPRRFYVAAGETLFVEAIGGSVVYTTPYLSDLDSANAASQSAIKPVAAECIRSGKSAVGWTLTNNSSATGSMAVTATGSPFGFPALKVTIPNDTGSVDISATGLGIPNFTAGQGKVVCHIYVEDELGIKQIRMDAGTSGLSTNMYYTHNLSNDNAQRANGHHILHLHPDHATANTMATSDGLDTVRLRINGQPAGGVVWIEGIYIPEPVVPWLITTVDDSDISMWTRFHAELSARGLKGTFNIDWNGVGSGAAFVTTANLDAMYEYGHDIVSHNRTNTAYPDENPPTTQPSDSDRLTYATEYRYCRGQLYGRGYRRGLGFHPFVQGAHDGALVDTLKAHGATLMRSAGTERNVEPFRLDKQSVVLMRKLGSGATLAQARAWVDSAVLRSQDVVLMGHVLAATSSDSITWAQSNFSALLDYALASGMRVGSVSEWCKARVVAV